LGGDAAFDPGEAIAHGAVHLDVTELPRALAFWRDLLGLTDLGGADGVAWLGVGGRELIVLHEGALVARDESGLAAIGARLEAVGVELEPEGDALFARDPAGNRFRLAA
jgi:catechol 2,3-dioxygenase